MSAVRGQNREDSVTCEWSTSDHLQQSWELHHGLLHPLKPTMLFEYLYLNLGESCEINQLQAHSETLVISFLKTGFWKTL